MNTSKKWMVSLAEEKYDWVRKIAEEAEIPGSAIIEEAIAKAMQDKAFRIGLVEAKTQLRIKELTEKRLTLDEEIKTLKSKSGLVSKILA